MSGGKERVSNGDESQIMMLLRNVSQTSRVNFKKGFVHFWFHFNNLLPSPSNQGMNQKRSEDEEGVSGHPQFWREQEEPVRSFFDNKKLSQVTGPPFHWTCFVLLRHGTKDSYLPSSSLLLTGWIIQFPLNTEERERVNWTRLLMKGVRYKMQLPSSTFFMLHGSRQ